ncbi:MAG TPA: pyruvate ferredoxin oxidoreductase [Candidatus Latescibacteria bacterium]|nr:pyruvate ferredoxin oxidoreductase [Candidatus Latescibacterota bacterium]
MGKVVALEGNQAAALAMRQINPDVVAAYPITPQTEVVQEFSQFVADGLVDTELIAVESEHSAMSACIGASASGARVMTATSANGMALMWEVLYIAASARLPIVMALVNRALPGNINIHCDHSDSMGARDSGWLQLFSENSQEVYDNLIQAVRIAEHLDVRLPVMVCYDGFIISHAVECLEVLEDDIVRNFIGELEPVNPLLDTDRFITYGPLDLYDFYFEHKRQQMEVYPTAKQVIVGIGKEFGSLAGREYGLYEGYLLDDAELAIVTLGSSAGTAKEAVDHLRSDGLPVGMLKLRCFRPFPNTEIAQVLSRPKAIAVLDRSVSFGGFGGPLFTEIRSAMFENETSPHLLNYIYGLGGRDIDVEDIEGVYKDLQRVVDTGNVERIINYVGLRG